MSALFFQQANSSGIVPYVVGYVVEEFLTNAGDIDIRTQIQFDYSTVAVASPQTVFLSAIIAPFTFIQSYDETIIKGLEGNPRRYKFGALHTYHENAIGHSYYINFETQTYPTNVGLIAPIPLPYPPIIEPPIPQSFQNILLMSAESPGSGITNFSPLVGISALKYDLSPSVIANIGYFYVCYANYSLSAPSNYLIVAL